MPLDEAATALQDLSTQDNSGDVSTVADEPITQVDSPDTGGDTSPPAEPTEQPTDGFRSKFKQKFGIDLSGKYKSDEEAEFGLANAYQLVGKRDADAEVGRLLRENPQGVLAHYVQQFPDLLNQAKPQPQAKKDDAPEWDEAWLEQVERDDKNNLIPKPGADPSLPAKILKRAKWEEKRSRDIALNFDQMVEAKAREIAQQVAAEISQQTVGQALGQHANAAQAAGWFEQNKTWMFNNGEAKPGNFTPRGAAFANLVSELAADGITDMQTQIKLATRMLGPEKPAANGGPIRARQATRQPNVAGATAGHGDGRRPGETPEAYGLRLLKKLGIND